jgi:hypothetical protein
MRQVYKELNQLNKGFEDVLRSLRSLRKHPSLHRNEIRRYEA